MNAWADAFVPNLLAVSSTDIGTVCQHRLLRDGSASIHVSVEFLDDSLILESRTSPVA